jgi:hypothetical protein
VQAPEGKVKLQAANYKYQNSLTRIIPCCASQPALKRGVENPSKNSNEAATPQVSGEQWLTLFRIRMPGQNREGAIDLLGEDDTRKLVRHRQR